MTGIHKLPQIIIFRINVLMIYYPVSACAYDVIQRDIVFPMQLVLHLTQCVIPHLVFERVTAALGLWGTLCWGLHMSR